MPPILDVTGYCPMGCGQTLHRMPGGMISCLAPGCPDKGAVTRILLDPETEHVIYLGEDSWTARHPLCERVAERLLSCDIHEVVADAPSLELDRFYRVSGDGIEWKWEPIEDPASATAAGSSSSGT